MRPAIFLDRDGTLNREVDYLADPNHLELLAGVGTGLKKLSLAGFALCVVTNQSGIARGLFSENTLSAIHDRLQTMLASEGVAIDFIGTCPHHPTVGEAPYRRECDCRKPKPGLLLQAASKLQLDLRSSWMIGDSERDLIAGQAAGCSNILVGTGKGQATLDSMQSRSRTPQHYAADFSGAVARILQQGEAV